MPPPMRSNCADGNVLVCGGSFVAAPSNSDFSCIRLRANGTVDSDFLPALIGAIEGRGNEAWALELQADGKIVVAGSAAGAVITGHHVLVVRLIGDSVFEGGFKGVDR